MGLETAWLCLPHYLRHFLYSSCSGEIWVLWQRSRYRASRAYRLKYRKNKNRKVHQKKSKLVPSLRNQWCLYGVSVTSQVSSHSSKPCTLRWLQSHLDEREWVYATGLATYPKCFQVPFSKYCVFPNFQKFLYCVVFGIRKRLTVVEDKDLKQMSKLVQNFLKTVNDLAVALWEPSQSTLLELTVNVHVSQRRYTIDY